MFLQRILKHMPDNHPEHERVAAANAAVEAISREVRPCLYSSPLPQLFFVVCALNNLEMVASLERTRPLTLALVCRLANRALSASRSTTIAPWLKTSYKR